MSSRYILNQIYVAQKQRQEQLVESRGNGSQAKGETEGGRRESLQKMGNGARDLWQEQSGAVVAEWVDSRHKQKSKVAVEPA
ncbi:hypothetical protein ACLKA6_013109 [Drosophila palustris]